MEDEIPFEVPNGWAWCRLGEICEVLDIDHKMPLQHENGIPYISPLNFFGQNEIDFNSAKKISEEDFIRLSKKCTPEIDDIIFPRYGTIGKVRLIKTDMKFLVSYSCAIIKHSKFYNPKYMYYFLQSSWIQKEEIKKYINESTQPNIGLASILKFLLPLPPLSEQKTIVSKIEEIFSQIDSLENNKTNLQTRIKHAKSKILDLAIHGKLVPQDPNDEPASKLLEKIHACNKNATDSGHYGKLEDVPFEIPDSWEWCKLGEICNFIGGGTPSKANSDFWNGNIPWASVKDIKGTCLYKTFDKISDTGLEKSSATLAEIDDLILVTRISPGKVIQTKIKTAINQDLKIIKLKIPISKMFLLYFFNWNEKYFITISNGTTVKGIKIEDLNSTLIPLPPLAEQKRIVAKIESLFSLLDKIQSELN